MTTVQLNIRMDEEFKKELHHKAIDEGMSLNKFIIKLLEKGLKEYDN